MERYILYRIVMLKDLSVLEHIYVKILLLLTRTVKESL